VNDPRVSQLLNDREPTGQGSTCIDALEGGSANLFTFKVGSFDVGLGMIAMGMQRWPRNGAAISAARDQARDGSSLFCTVCGG
jgi:hypothetical protein